MRDILIAILNQFNWEYCIESNNNVIYSSNYKNIINNKVDFNIFKFNNTYYQKINRRIVLDDKEYKIECLEDVTKYINIISELKIDSLTGLKTRTDLKKYLSLLDKRSIFVLCDLDDFKNINDTYGHQVGDEILKLFGEILRTYVNDKMYVARYGGEEFLMIFNDTNIEEVKFIIDKINQELIIKSNTLHVSFSAGIAFYDNDRKIDETIRKADLALYYVKNNGKNNSYVYDSTLENILKKEKKYRSDYGIGVVYDKYEVN